MVSFVGRKNRKLSSQVSSLSSPPQSGRSIPHVFESTSSNNSFGSLTSDLTSEEVGNIN